MKNPTSTFYTRTRDGATVKLTKEFDDYSGKAETLACIKKHGFRFCSRCRGYSIYTSDDKKDNYIKVYHY